MCRILFGILVLPRRHRCFCFRLYLCWIGAMMGIEGVGWICATGVAFGLRVLSVRRHSIVGIGRGEGLRGALLLWASSFCQQTRERREEEGGREKEERSI